MAELLKRGDVFYARFYTAPGERRTMSLRTTSQRKAERFRGYVEDLLAARKTGCPLDAATAAWLSQLKNKERSRLAQAGLLDEEPPEATTTSTGSLSIEKYIETYIKRRADAKQATKTKWRHAQRNLVAFFGNEKLITEVTAGDAKDFERFLKTTARHHRYADKAADEGLSGNTVRKRICDAKQIFQDAVDREIIAKNPFAGLKSSTTGNADRFHFIDRGTVERVLQACPDAEWRLIFALCRFGGLRCPSEILRFRLSDVNWETERFLVHSPKTEHHEGKDKRWVPIFPELRPYVDAIWDNAEEGQEFFIVRGQGKSEAYFRTGLMKILKRAGVKPWPKLFQNLRSTRQTELEELFPTHVVCEWLGNSPRVAQRHYLQTTDDHFAAAVRTPSGAPIGAPIRAAHPSALPSCTPQAATATCENPEKNGVARHAATGDAVLMGDEGLEPPTPSV